MMRAVPLVVVMLLTGCSFAGAGPVPSVSAVNVSQPASPSAAPIEVLRLKSQESVRGADVLVPAGWSMDGTDGGGSGSMSVWTDPANEGSWIAVWDGMELGAWLETDGVTGSVDPSAMLPEGAEVVRESRTVFRYSYSNPLTGLIVRGAWIAGVDEVSGQADGYERVEVSLPVEQDSVVEEILGAFIEQAKARFAGGGSPSGDGGNVGQPLGQDTVFDLEIILTEVTCGFQSVSQNVDDLTSAGEVRFYDGSMNLLYVTRLGDCFIPGYKGAPEVSAWPAKGAWLLSPTVPPTPDGIYQIVIGTRGRNPVSYNASDAIDGVISASISVR